MPSHVATLTSLLAAVALATGCTRSQHVRRADADSYEIIAEKANGAPWAAPAGFDVRPDPRSRFHDPTCFVHPQLPIPSPVLYGYALPELNGMPPAENGSEIEELPPIDDQRSDKSVPGSGQVRPLEAEIWESLPPSCLRRMLEFQSIREEYHRSFEDGQEPPIDTPSPRLTLPAIVELASINSREFQTQKEQLYQAALRLSLERYAYEWLFLPRGNGVDADYLHARNRGNTVNSFSSFTTAGVQRVTKTGADVLATFANHVLLTFNGPTGFSSRIGSELLFRVTQSVFQRDVIFESLTQAERDVIYAARDFARFRKQFFADLAREYYALLLTYRSIEIDSLDYFSNLREFLKGQATFRAGQLPLIQVDQFEQNALRSRSNLIGSCNSLERSLDRLKLRIGVPPEMPLNLDLAELEELTRRDSLAATLQLGARTRRNLEEALGRTDGDLSVQVSSAIKLAQRLQRIVQLNQQAASSDRAASDDAGEGSSPPPSAERPLEVDEAGRLMRQFQLLEALLRVAVNQQVLASELQAEPPPAPLRLFQRRLDLARSLLAAKRAHLRSEPSSEDRTPFEKALDAAGQRIDDLDESVRIAVRKNEVDAIDNAVAMAPGLLSEARRVAGFQPQELATPSIRAAMAPALEQLFALANQLASAGGKLAAFEISVDDAMLTAVTQRYELANVREQLADAWRQIKLRGDDLRAVMTWSYRQSIRTPNDHNRPFSFSFNDSDSRIAMSFDAPLNRLAERNAFRQSLIAYNRQLRELIAAEDQIKLAVRNDLRNLELARNQYEIAVDGAALAFERVSSTRLQLDLGRGTARDFLEAQQAFTQSLNAVASEHVGYLVERLQLFLDLEQLEVDQFGSWPDLYNESAQPQVRTQLPVYGMSAYGGLPPVHYSREIRQMLSIPPGDPSISIPLEPSTSLGDPLQVESVSPPSESSTRQVPVESVPLPPPQPRDGRQEAPQRLLMP